MGFLCALAHSRDETVLPRRTRMRVVPEITPIVHHRFCRPEHDAYVTFFTSGMARPPTSRRSISLFSPSDHRHGMCAGCRLGGPCAAGFSARPRPRRIASSNTSATDRSHSITAHPPFRRFNIVQSSRARLATRAGARPVGRRAHQVHGLRTEPDPPGRLTAPTHGLALLTNPPHP